jgi:uncharacterized protein YcbK (DUF882 family)
VKWQYFTRDEFECRCGCGTNLIDDDIITRLDVVRKRVGFAMTVTSGYRCPNYNKRVSTTGENGPHTTGRAADIRVSGDRAFRLVRTAFEEGFTGIGVMQRGGTDSRFVHLDDLVLGPRPRIWSY